MQNTCKILFLLLIAPVFCLAQSNFKDGYVVTLKGDTLKGLIDYREWDSNPSEIHFKINNLSKTEAYSANNISAFEINGLEKFQRYTVPVSTDHIAITDAVFSIDTVKHFQTVFLKVLVKGDNVNLYSYTDNVKSRYYFSEKGNTPVELNYWIYNAGENSSTDIRYNRRYRVQMVYLAQKFKPNTSTITRDISNAEYSESALVKIIKQINNATTLQLTADANTGTQFFVGGGVSYGDVKFDGTGIVFADDPGTTVSHTPMPYLTAGLNFYVNKNIRSLYFVLELSLMTDQHKLQGTDTYGLIAVKKVSTLDYRQYMAVLSPQIAYNFYNTHHLKVFANVGAGLNFSAYNSYNLVEAYSNDPDQTPRLTPKFPKFQTFWFSPIIKAGVTLNQKIDVYAGMQLPSAFTNYNLYAASASKYQLGIHYLLGK
jgi:hypothetical protein